MKYHIIIIVLLFPIISLAQIDPCKINLESLEMKLRLDWAQILIRNNLKKVECYLGVNTDYSNPGYQLMDTYTRNDSSNAVWETYKDRRGKVLGHVYYSFDQRILIDTILSFGENRNKLLNQSYYKYDSLSRLREKKVIYSYGDTIIDNYRYQKFENRIQKERITISDSIIFRSVEYYSLDGSLMKKYSNDYKSSINRKTYYHYQHNEGFIHEISINNEDTVSNRFIWGSEECEDSVKFISSKGDTLIEKRTVFDSDSSVLKIDFFQAGQIEKSEVYYFDHEMKIIKSTVEFPLDRRVIKRTYNRFELIDSEIEYLNGIYRSSLHYSYETNP